MNNNPVRRIKSIFIAYALALIVILQGCKESGVIPPVDESNIRLVASYSTNASTNGVYIFTVDSRNYAFIADGTNGLQIVDVTFPNSPDSVSSVNTGGSANDVFVAVINNDLYAFVSDYNSGLNIIDVSDVLSPYSVGTISGLYTSTSYIDASLEIAYVGQAGGAVTIYDISALPNSVNSLGSVSSNCSGVHAGDGRLYITNGMVGFSIYDVSNPASPSLLSLTNTSGSASCIYVVQNYAYVADSYNGTLVFNVSNPSAPSLLSRIAPQGQVLGVAVNNNTLYTADNTYGVESINVSNPSAPSQNGYIKLNSSANNIFYFGGYLYLAAAEGGLGILQPTN